MSHDESFESLQRELQRLFHDLVYHRHPSSHFGEPTWSPPADLVVTESSASVILELAGVPRQNVRVRLHGNVLEITGRREPPHGASGAYYHRAEIYFGDFKRVIELPWLADENHVDAKYREGMLEIQLVRAPQPQHAEISIEQHT